MFGNAGLEFFIETVKILDKPTILFDFLHVVLGYNTSRVTVSVRPWKTWEKKL